MIVDEKKALDILRMGGILIYPTDTAFGIGCRIDYPNSVKKLFEIRKRDEKKAVPVLFDSIEKVKEYVLLFDSNVEELMNKFWPGALTIVLKCDLDKVSPLVRGGGDTLGVRIPENDKLRNLIRNLGVPIIGTSANFAGENTPFSLEDLNLDLINLVDGVISGKTKENLSSTVVDCTSTPWKILRQGSININL